MKERGNKPQGNGVDGHGQSDRQLPHLMTLPSHRLVQDEVGLAMDASKVRIQHGIRQGKVMHGRRRLRRKGEWPGKRFGWGDAGSGCAGGGWACEGMH